MDLKVKFVFGRENMNYSIINGSISYGADTILEEINFEIKDKDKIAIVGRNGSGKSTLIKSFINNEMLEQGIGEAKFGVYKQGNPSIGFLRQIEFDDETTTFLDEILKSYSDIVSLENRINELQKRLQDETSDEIVKQYSESLERYEMAGGYTYKKEYETAIRKFGFSEADKFKKLCEFSGGQRTKIAFLKLLLSKPDILLLDEPTNHLDITAIEWLEGYLKNFPKAVVIVSHDRMFLNRIVNKVYEIEYGVTTAYPGNYADFEKQKKENYEKQLKDFEYQQKEIKRLQAIADRFRYKPTKAKMALSKLKAIERMKIIEEPNKYDLKTFHTNFDVTTKSGDLVVSAKALEIGYDTVLSKVNFELFRGQKLAVIGENGKGKSTLLKTLIRKIPSLGGEFEFGYNVIFRYFDQQMEFENPDATVFEDFSKEFPKMQTTEVRNALGAFLFSGDDVFKEINLLSGGERVRLQLCKIFNSNANLLFLDEPTNHLDIVGKESLENILQNYNGSLVFVSHDRYFVNKIADLILAFEADKVVFFKGNYEEFCRYKASLETDEKNENVTVKDEKKSASNSYFQSKEETRRKNKILKLENKIEEKEEQIRLLKEEMESEEICSDYIKLKEFQDKIDEIEAEVTGLLTEWEELSEKLLTNL